MSDWLAAVAVVVLHVALVVFAVALPLAGPDIIRWVSGVRAGENSLWEAIPPYNPPHDPMTWRVLATLRLAPKPKLPCGCRAEWREVFHIYDGGPDGTLEGVIGRWPDSEREYRDVREVSVDNRGVVVTTEHARVINHLECGRHWKDAPSFPPPTPVLPGAETEIYEHPPDSSSMRALPDGWTRLDRGLAEQAGQVTEYVHDEDWEAFVDVYDTDHDGNSYDPRKGDVIAVLKTGSPSAGLWEREENYGDDRNGAAKPLMEAFNEGEYE